MDLFHKVIWPMLALLVGIAITAWWNNQTLTMQELTVALQIKGSNTAEREAREWADRTITTYLKARQPVTSATPSPPPPPSPLEGLSGLAKDVDLAKDICIVPQRVVVPRDEFYVDREGDKLVGKHYQIVLEAAVTDYRKLARQYDVLYRILTKTCGYLLKPAETKG